VSSISENIIYMSLSSGYSNLKERRVVELRKEGMSYKQIAKEAMISVRDIKPILVKYGVNDISGYSGNGGEEGSDLVMSISSDRLIQHKQPMGGPVIVVLLGRI
jgi:hypothetical protein